MKYDVKKYLVLGAVLAGSAFMVSCDGDDVSVNEVTPDYDAQEAAKNKPVAPIALAQFPVTSLKLSFNEAAGDCLGAAFEAGDELEIDFDSTTATSATDTTGDAVADLDQLGGANGLVFGTSTTQGFVEGIVANPAASSWTIASVYANAANATGDLILSDLTLTPLSSDLRSVTGHFAAVAPEQVAFNQDTENVVADSGDAVETDGSVYLDTPNGSVQVTKVTVYQDVTGKPVEIQSLDGSVTFEPSLAGNWGVSVKLESGCVVNFVVAPADAQGAGVAEGQPIDVVVATQLVALLDVTDTADVSGVDVDLTAVVADPQYLVAGADADNATVEGSYRHDFDSSTGTIEPGINSQIGYDNRD